MSDLRQSDFHYHRLIDLFKFYKIQDHDTGIVLYDKVDPLTNTLAKTTFTVYNLPYFSCTSSMKDQFI